MSKEKTTVQYSGGVSFTGLLFLVFLVLKLTGVISWSWWWVTAPLWGGLALFLAIVFGGLIIAGIIALIALIAKLLIKRRKKNICRL